MLTLLPPYNQSYHLDLFLHANQVYEALSSKNWGASSTLLADIASETGD